MNKIKKYCLLSLPYFICIIAGCIFYALGSKFNSDLKGLIQGIAGSFLSIPILYLIYELSRNYSQQKINKELFDYAKMQIDRDVLAIINQLMKAILPYEKVAISPENIKTFLSQSQSDLVATIKTNEYLGFQVFKNWSITERNITEILENSFILQRLDNDQLIAIIALLKEIRAFEFIPKNMDDLYILTGEKAKEYKIESGENLNERNNEYPDRYILLKHLEQNEFIVIDFGDFALYQKEKLLQIYRINDKYLDNFAISFLGVINSIKLWVELTGYEFIIDKKMVRSSLRKNV